MVHNNIYYIKSNIYIYCAIKINSMKQLIIWRILGFFLLLTTFSNSSFSQSPTEVLAEMKDDKDFISFAALSESLVNIYKENHKGAPRGEETREEDSVYMRDTETPLEEKFEVMQYKGLDIIKGTYAKMYEIYVKFEDTYPSLAALNEEEFSEFCALAAAYYKNQKTQ